MKKLLLVPLLIPSIGLAEVNFNVQGDDERGIQGAFKFKSNSGFYFKAAGGYRKREEEVLTPGISIPAGQYIIDFDHGDPVDGTDKPYGYYAVTYEEHTLRVNHPDDDFKIGYCKDDDCHRQGTYEFLRDYEYDIVQGWMGGKEITILGPNNIIVFDGTEDHGRIRGGSGCLNPGDDDCEIWGRWKTDDNGVTTLATPLLSEPGGLSTLTASTLDASLEVGHEWQVNDKFRISAGVGMNFWQTSVESSLKSFKDGDASWLGYSLLGTTTATYLHHEGFALSITAAYKRNLFLGNAVGTSNGDYYGKIEESYTFNNGLVISGGYSTEPVDIGLAEHIEDDLNKKPEFNEGAFLSVGYTF